MAALGTRYAIHSQDDHYLTPLPATIVPDNLLDSYLEPLWDEAQKRPLTPIYKEDTKGKPRLIAEGFEFVEPITRALFDEETDTWNERRLVVRSISHATAQEEKLNERLDKAEVALGRLTERKRGKKPLTTLDELETARQNILKQYDVEGLIEVHISTMVSRRKIRSYAGKKERFEQTKHFNLTTQRNDAVIETVVRRMGWRVYATTVPAERFSLDRLVHVYRDQYIIERGNSRLKGKPLSLSPLYRQREDHMTGLVRLLSIDLYALTLLEFVVREALKKTEPLTNIYAGNPKRVSQRPSAELLLRAFKNVFRVSVNGHSSVLHMTPLQHRILKLLGFSESVYVQMGTILNTG